MRCARRRERRTAKPATNKRIKSGGKVYVKDFDDKVGGYAGFRNLLQGNVPWAEVRAALEEFGYDVHPELGLKHIADCLRAVLG